MGDDQEHDRIPEKISGGTSKIQKERITGARDSAGFHGKRILFSIF